MVEVKSMRRLPDDAPSFEVWEWMCEDCGVVNESSIRTVTYLGYIRSNIDPVIVKKCQECDTRYEFVLG